MSLPRTLIVLAFLSVSLEAQEQERKLMDRLTRPNMDQTYDVRNSSYGGSRNFSAGKAAVKEFGFAQRFRPKAFSARTYSASKYNAAGDFRFATKGASTKGRYDIPNATRQADSKVMPVKNARESTVAMDTEKFNRGDRQYLGLEWKKFSKSIDPNEQPAGWQGNELKPLTIEDIRTMLNKNE